MSSIIGKHLNYDAKNLIINGNMDFAQRAPGGTVGMTVSQYTSDRWKWLTTSATPQTNFVWDTSVPTVAQSGYYSNKSTKLNAVTTFSPGSTDLVELFQAIEGYNVLEIMGQPITFSFWVKANFTGIGCVNFNNAGGDRSYVLEYTIAQANVWQKVVMRLTMLDGSSGSWNFTNGSGVNVGFVLAAGSSVQTTPGAWQTGGPFYATSNQFNFYSSNTNTIQFAQVMLKVGSPSSPFERAGITYSKELELCQRYYEKSYDVDVAPGTITDNGATQFAFKDSANGIALYYTYYFKVNKRSTPGGPLHTYSPNTGTVDVVTNINQNNTQNDVAASAIIQGTSCITVEVNSSSNTAGFKNHWSQDVDF